MVDIQGFKHLFHGEIRFLETVKSKYVNSFKKGQNDIYLKRLRSTDIFEDQRGRIVALHKTTSYELEDTYPEYYYSAHVINWGTSTRREIEEDIIRRAIHDGVEIDTALSLLEGSYQYGFPISNHTLASRLRKSKHYMR
jgi:hypothetical protein